MVRNEVCPDGRNDLPLVCDSQVVYVEGKANKQRNDEQTICNNRRVHILCRQSEGDERLDIIRKLRRVAKMIPGPIEKNVGQPTLMRLRKLVPAPVDRLIIAQESIDQGKD